MRKVEFTIVECCEACGLPQKKEVLGDRTGILGHIDPTGQYFKHNIPEDCVETFKKAILSLYRWAEKKR